MRISVDGDSGSHGGQISAITSKTYVNGRLVLTKGAIYHCPEHGEQVVVGHSPDVFAEGMPVARLNDQLSCGAVIVSASPDTHANG